MDRVALSFIVLIALYAPASGETNPPPDPPRATLAVIMDFQDPYSSVLLEAMERELERIMAPSNLRLEWRFYEDSLGKEVFHSLAVVRFKGRCRTGESPARPDARSALGLTHITGDAILPYADVHCDQVRKLVLPEIRSESYVRAEVRLGRALGRVVAHELYHILARTTRHGDSGLAKSVLTPQDLLLHEFTFQEPEAERIREATAAWASHPSESPADEK